MLESIVCLLEMGLAKHPILLPDGAKITAPFHELPIYILNLSRDYENYNIKIFGQSEYAEQVVEGIKEEEIKQYGKNLLNIEIIGGNK